MKYKWMALVLLACAAASNVALAQEKPGAREREALRRVQSQLQTVQQAQTALQDKLRVADEEKAALEKRINGVQSRASTEAQKSKELQSTLDAAQAENNTVQAENKTLQATKVDLEQRLKTTLERVAVLEKDLAQTSAQLKTSEGALIGRNRQVNACEKRNTELYGLGRKLVEQCRDTSVVDASQIVDHITGARRVAFESLMEDFRDKLDSERLLQTDLAQ
jgi:chromosome segregation ATPase